MKDVKKVDILKKLETLNYRFLNKYADILDYNSIVMAQKEGREMAGFFSVKRDRSAQVQLLTAEELNLFFETASKIKSERWRIALNLLYTSMMRVTEFRMLQVKDINLGNATIFIKHGKGSKVRHTIFDRGLVPAVGLMIEKLHPEAYFFSKHPNRPYSRQHIYDQVRKIAKAAGISKDVHPHLFRHQMITYLLANKIHPSVLRKYTGHKSSETLEQEYEHLTAHFGVAEYHRILDKHGHLSDLMNRYLTGDGYI